MPELTRLTIRLPREQAEEAAAFLADNTPQGWQELEEPASDTLVLLVHLEDPAHAERVVAELARLMPEAAVSLDKVEDQDWTSAWRDFFTPVDAGNFLVLPPWRADEAPVGRRIILIEPKMAFGTGHHATTALCLEAIDALSSAGRLTPGMRFLDLGTGSGILGIGLAMLGLSGSGLDVDPQAISCAAENVSLNAVNDRLTVAVGSQKTLPDGERYDLVVANILSGPLIHMAETLAPRVAEGGVLVLSGILAEQAAGVVAAYQAQGLGEPVIRNRGEWVSLTWS